MSIFHRLCLIVVGLTCFLLSGVCVLGVAASFLADVPLGVVGSTAGFMITGVAGAGFMIFGALESR